MGICETPSIYQIDNLLASPMDTLVLLRVRYRPILECVNRAQRKALYGRLDNQRPQRFKEIKNAPTYNKNGLPAVYS